MTRVWVSLLAVLYIWSGPVSAGLTLPDVVIRIAEDRAEALRTEVENGRAQIERTRSILNQYRDLVQSAQRDLEGMSNWATRASRNFVIQEIERRQGMLREAEARLNDLITATQSKETALAQAEQDLATLVADRQRLADLRVRQDAEIAANIERERIERENRYDMSLGDVLGIWRPREGEGDWPFVIVQAEPGSEAYPYRLEAHTGSRIWKGDYEPLDRGDPSREHQARIQFKYTPNASEMNPIIPAWARDELEGELEWVLELDEAGSPTDSSFAAKWYPGEVEWTEDGEVAILGRGSPNRFSLQQEFLTLVEESSHPVLTVELASGGDTRFDNGADAEESSADGRKPYEPFSRVEALLKHQAITVKLQVPPHMAKDLGDSVKVKVVGTKNGSETELTLLRRTPNGPRPVIFSLSDPVTIANRGSEEDLNPQFGSIPWIASFWSLETGRRIDLDVDDHEVVEFRYEDTVQPVMVYDKWYQRAIDQHVAAASALAVLYQNSLAANDLPDLDRDAARLAQKRLANYATLMAQDDLLELHKYFLGELYVGRGLGSTLATVSTSDPGVKWQKAIVHLTDSDLNLIVGNLDDAPSSPKYFTEIVKGFVATLRGGAADPVAIRMADAVDWTSNNEKLLVAQVLQLTSEKVESDIQDVVGEIVYAMPRGIIQDVAIIFQGKDLRGKKKTDLDRAVVGSKILLQAALSLAVTGGVRVLPRFATLPPMGPLQRMRVRLHRPIATPFTGRSMLRSNRRGDGGHTGTGATSTDAQAVSRAAPDLPDSLTDAQISNVALKLEADPPGDGAMVWSPPHRPPRAPGPDGQPQPLTPGQLQAEAAALHGPEIRVIGQTDTLIIDVQTGGTCNVHAVQHGIQSGTGRRIPADDLINEAVEIEMSRTMFDKAIDTDRRRLPDGTRPDPNQPESYYLTPGERLSYMHGHTSTFADHKAWVMENGIRGRTVRDLLRRHGASVAEVPPSKNGRLKVRHIEELLDKGYHVKVAIDLTETLGSQHGHALHAVQVTGFTRQDGMITGVRFLESNLGVKLEYPLHIFERRIARTSLDGTDLPFGNLTAYRFGNGSWDADFRISAPGN